MSIPPSIKPKLLAGDTWVVQGGFSVSSLALLLALTMASTAGPPVKMSPQEIYTNI